MSKRKDRERAESGIIHRDGRLVNRDEWLASHPTREMLQTKQAQVDAAVVQEMDNKPYFCSKCNRTHKSGQVFTAHREFKKEG